MNQRCQLHTISPAASASAMTALPFAAPAAVKKMRPFPASSETAEISCSSPFVTQSQSAFHAVGKRDRGIVSAAVAAHRSVEHIIAGLADDITVGGSVPAQVDGRHRRLHGRQCRRSRTPRLAVAVGDGQRHGRFRRSCGRRNIERACVGIPLAPGGDDNRPAGEGLIRLGGESQPLQIVARHREGEPLLLPDRKFDGILPGERDFQFDRFLLRFVVVTARCKQGQQTS